MIVCEGFKEIRNIFTFQNGSINVLDKHGAHNIYIKECKPMQFKIKNGILIVKCS